MYYVEDYKKPILLGKVYKSYVTQKGKKMSEEKLVSGCELQSIFFNVFFFCLTDFFKGRDCS